MIISDRVKNLLNKVLPLFENITFGDIIQRMQQDIEAGGGGGLPVASQAEAEAGIVNDKTMTPLRVLESINANAPGGGGSAQAITTITFDPDIAVSTATNKKTFVEIQTAINAAPGQVWIVVKKAGVLQAANVDSGVHVWDWTKVQRVMPDPDSVNPRLVFPEGSTITLPGAMYLDGVTIEYIGTSGPLATVSTINVIVANYGNISTGIGAGAEAFRVAPGGLFYIHLQGASSGLYRGDYEVIDSRGTLTVYIWGKTAGAFFGNTDIFRNDPSGSGTVIIDSQVLASGGYTATHANYTDGDEPIPVTVYQRYEERVGELITAQAAAAVQSQFFGVSTMPRRQERRGFDNGINLSTSVILANPDEPIADRQIMILEVTIMVGKITAGVPSYQARKYFATVVRNGSITSLVWDIQQVVASPVTGPNITVSGFDNGAGVVGLSITLNEPTGTYRMYSNVNVLKAANELTLNQN